MENTINATENQIQVFNQQEVLGKDFRIYGDAENPLFLAKDVAVWIENSNVSQMLNTIDTSEKALYIVYTLGGLQSSWFLTEDGLYEVLMQSRKPIAKEFKTKVKEILKDIRKHGVYMTPETLQRALSDPRAMGEILIAYANEKEKSAQLKAQNEVLAVTIEEQKPAVEFTDHVANTKDVLDMRRFSLLAQKNGIDLGRNNMFKKLQELGYLDWNNVPYQKYIKAGYFKAIESVYKKGKSKHITVQTFITGKGQIYLIKKLRFVYGLSNDDAIDLAIDE